MKPYQVTSSSIIDAPADRVYEIIADYRNRHPLILPKPYFVSLEVEEGGFGAGTTINFTMRVFGKTQTFRAAVTEPDPGRELVETDLDGGPVTTFRVSSINDGKRSNVVIITAGRTIRDGVMGMVERFMTEGILARIYKKELRQLAIIAQSRTR